MSKFTDKELVDLEYCINHQIGYMETFIRHYPVNLDKGKAEKHKVRLEQLLEKVRKM